MRLKVAKMRQGDLMKDLNLNEESGEEKESPSSRIRTSDLWMPVNWPTTVHRSTNWAIEGDLFLTKFYNY